APSHPEGLRRGSAAVPLDVHEWIGCHREYCDVGSGPEPLQGDRSEHGFAGLLIESRGQPAAEAVSGVHRRFGVHYEWILDLSLIPGTVDPPVHAWRQRNLRFHMVEVAGCDAVPEPERSAAMVWAVGERSHLPILDRRHL